MKARSAQKGGSESGSDPLSHAIGLLSQQIWCWGQDILRKEGNWLIEVGFSKLKPPEAQKECASVYTLHLPRGRCVVLRGFGVFYGDRSRGGVFLPRFEFQPQYTVLSVLDCPPFSYDDLPDLMPPTKSQRNDCLALTLALLKWICDYEVTIRKQLGLDYRRQTLVRWDDGKNPFTPAEQLVPAWRELTHDVAANFDAYSLNRKEKARPKST